MGLLLPLALTGCAGQTSYAEQVRDRPVPTSDLARQAECEFLRSEIARQERLGQMGASAALIPQTAMEFQAAAQKNVAALQTRAAGIHCPPTANDGPSAAYTLGTPLEAIASDPAGAAVINRDIPGLLSDPSYSLIKGMSLKAVASLSGGQITDEMLARTEADLKALSKPAPSEP